MFLFCKHLHVLPWFSYGFPMVFLLFLWFPRPRKGRSPGMLAMACQLVQSHGPRRLLSGAGATFTGYFLHGAFKYGSLTEKLDDTLWLFVT